ncbi:MAG: acyl-CoA thioesterase [Gammaproteobacteria bacterium]|nr:acyl-CoA thioesterase [Gammaproteobacteria bacterium]MCW5583987.1 acyl-CoA thioesterase [Gammaproteobacteria bacterium]
MKNQTQPTGQLVIQIVAMPADTNANGDIFGGWLVSYMDMGAGIAAKRQAASRAVTVAIDSLIFIKPVSVGDTVSFYANLLKVGRTSMQFKIEAWTMAIHEEKNNKVAEGLFTFVAIDDQGRPHPVVRNTTTNCR